MKDLSKFPRVSKRDLKDTRFEGDMERLQSLSEDFMVICVIF